MFNLDVFTNKKNGDHHKNGHIYPYRMLIIRVLDQGRQIYYLI